jgi:hypothetical protein
MSSVTIETIVDELEHAVRLLDEVKPHRDCKDPQIHRGGLMFVKDALSKLKLYAEPRKAPTQQES